MTRKKARFILSFVFLVLTLQAGCRSPEQKASKQEIEPPRKLLDYVEVTTAGVEAEADLPLIVAVHGLGDEPQSFKRLLMDMELGARVIVPRAPMKWHMGFAWFTTRIASGKWDALSSGIESAAYLVSELASYLAETKPTKGKPIICGFSQGGMISFAVAVRHPETVGLSIPISGMLPKPSWPKKIKPGVVYPPIRALHGEADDLVPIDLSRDTVDSLKSVGLDAELKSYPGVPHSISGEMRRDLIDLIRNKI